MKSVVVPQKGQLELAEIPIPAPGSYQALVRIECCGICGSTDWKIINGHMTWAKQYPLVLGHESVGRVVEVGANVRKFKVGDRVTRPVYPADPDRGLYSAMGGFSEYGLVTDAVAMSADGDPSLLGDYTALRQNVVPAGLGAVEASLAISLSETASVLAGLPSLRNRTVIIAGTGIAGLSLTLWAKMAGARVVTLGRRGTRMAAARALGADATVDTTMDNWQAQVLKATGGLVDGVIEAIGDVAFSAMLLKFVKAGGFACAYGAPEDGQAYPTGWSVAPVEEHLAYGWVADMLKRGWVRSEWFATQIWPLDDAVKAFDFVRRGDIVKGFVLMG